MASNDNNNITAAQHTVILAASATLDEAVGTIAMYARRPGNLQGEHAQDIMRHLDRVLGWMEDEGLEQHPLYIACKGAFDGATLLRQAAA